MNKESNIFKNIITVLLALLVLGLMAGTASAANATVNLGNAGNFAILAGSAITGSGTGTNVITGNVGLSPTTGAAITLLTCAEVTGKIYDINGGYTGGGSPNIACLVTDASLLATAKSDLTTAYNDAAGRTATPAGAVTETPVKPTGTATAAPTPVPTKKVPGFEFALAIAILSVAYLSGRKRR